MMEKAMEAIEEGVKVVGYQESGWGKNHGEENSSEKEKLNRAYNERGGTDEGDHGGEIVWEEGPGRKRIGMIYDYLDKERYGVLKRRAEDRQECSVWLPGICRTAEHWRRRRRLSSRCISIKKWRRILRAILALSILFCFFTEIHVQLSGGCIFNSSGVAIAGVNIFTETSVICLSLKWKSEKCLKLATI